VERSLELVELTRRVYATVNASDVATMRELFLNDPATSVIGTDDAEWWSGYAEAAGTFGVQLEEARGWWHWESTGLDAFVHGEMGWATDRVVVTTRERVTTIRSTIVYCLSHAQWRIAHWHVSVGSSNVEQLGKELTTAIDALAQAVERERPSVSGAAAGDGTVTLLFSDIEGSTRLLEELGDRRYMELLRWHDGLIRGSLVAHDGYEVRTEGDSFMLAFSSARRALLCALDVQRRLLEDPPDGLPSIKVRMGAHTGEALRDHNRFYGHVVHFAARVSSEAHGGEVLASTVVHDLVAGSDEITFGDGRRCELKGFTGEQVVYPVRGGKAAST
jgi:class 3 adenylate cyclase